MSAYSVDIWQSMDFGLRFQPWMDFLYLPYPNFYISVKFIFNILTFWVEVMTKSGVSASSTMDFGLSFRPWMDFLLLVWGVEIGEASDFWLATSDPGPPLAIDSCSSDSDTETDLKYRKNKFRQNTIYVTIGAK